MWASQRRVVLGVLSVPVYRILEASGTSFVATSFLEGPSPPPSLFPVLLIEITRWPWRCLGWDSSDRGMSGVTRVAQAFLCDS